LEIIDMTGHLMRSGGKELVNTLLSIDGFGTGLYLVRIKAANQVLIGKFIKK